jgi:hypothetical protein
VRIVFLPNSIVLGKLPIRAWLNNRVNWKLLLVDLAKIQYTRDGEGPDLWNMNTLTNIDNELSCYSNEFHSHLPFDKLWVNSYKIQFCFHMKNEAAWPGEISFCTRSQTSWINFSVQSFVPPHQDGHCLVILTYIIVLNVTAGTTFRPIEAGRLLRTHRHHVNKIWDLHVFTHSYFNRWFGDSMKVQYNSLTMLLSSFMQEFGPISSRVYCIFAQITK